MQLTTFLATTLAVLATSVSGAAIEAAAAVTRNTAKPSCPADKPNYCGWFDKVNNQPPTCKPHVAQPAPLPQPSCPSGQAAYCTRSPAEFCPYGTCVFYSTAPLSCIYICIYIL